MLACSDLLKKVIKTQPTVEMPLVGALLAFHCVFVADESCHIISQCIYVDLISDMILRGMVCCYSRLTDCVVQEQISPATSPALRGSCSARSWAD